MKFEAEFGSQSLKLRCEFEVSSWCIKLSWISKLSFDWSWSLKFDVEVCIWRSKLKFEVKVWI